MKPPAHRRIIGRESQFTSARLRDRGATGAGNGQGSGEGNVRRDRQGDRRAGIELDAATKIVRVTRLHAERRARGEVDAASQRQDAAGQAEVADIDVN